MKTAKLFPATLLATALACTPALAVASPPSTHHTIGQDMHKAGRDTKNAAKHTGRAVKKGSKDTYNDTKHGSKKAWRATKHGTKKAWHKTKSTTKGAYNGAKNGASH